MNGKATIRCEKDRLVIAGSLDFTSVVDVWQASLPLLENYSQWNFDFSEVNCTKSAGLALLVEWMTLAKSKNKIIHFYHIPKQLMLIANTCGVDALLVNNI